MVCDVYQYLLPSGRGVRMKRLNPRERNEILANAAREVSADANGLELRLCEVLNGCHACIVQVTTESGYDSEDALADADAKAVADGKSIWRNVTPAIMADEYNVLFDALDDDVLSKVWRRHHEASPTAVERIVGKGRKVSMG